jgi:hypothetical protein
MNRKGNDTTSHERGVGPLATKNLNKAKTQLSNNIPDCVCDYPLRTDNNHECSIGVIDSLLASRVAAIVKDKTKKVGTGQRNGEQRARWLRRLRAHHSAVQQPAELVGCLFSFRSRCR